MKKFTCLLLVLTQLLLLAACAEGETEDTTPTPEVSGESTDTEAQEETELMPDLPEKDFGGDDFIFVSNLNVNDWVKLNIVDIYAEEETGEGLNDAVFQRNMYLNDTCGIVIGQVLDSDPNGKVRNSIAAQDGAYDVMYTRTGHNIGLASSGSFLDYNTMPYVDFDMPWWDNNAMGSLSVAGKTYVAVNDIMLANHNATAAVLFNKQMIADHGFTENPYDLVLENKWSIDKVSEMSKVVHNDVDGNGVYDENDVYGFMCYRDASLSMFHSSGGLIVKKDKEGIPQLTLMRESTYDSMLKSLTLMAEPSTFNLHKMLEKTHPTDLYSVTEDMFRNDQGLFYWILIHDVQLFRDMESDFGILPVPSADPEKYGYRCGVNRHHGYLMSVLTTADPDQAGYILELMSAKSHYTVQDEYYNVCLTRKYSRDEQSAEMLDIIFDNRVYDFGAFYNIGNQETTFIMMTMTNETNMASKYAGSKRAAQKAIDKLLKTYEELE
ncbi:MAG: hypothetical protein IJC71_02760 [Clostridia bacterium]|nr:hypothetical protein [Clostridia bacterium]